MIFRFSIIHIVTFAIDFGFALKRIEHVHKKAALGINSWPKHLEGFTNISGTFCSFLNPATLTGNIKPLHSAHTLFQICWWVLFPAYQILISSSDVLWNQECQYLIIWQWGKGNQITTASVIIKFNQVINSVSIPTGLKFGICSTKLIGRNYSVVALV